MGTTSRIYELHRLFKGVRGRSLQQLIDHFEASRANIERDIELMQPFNEFGTVPEIIGLFGGKPGYESAIRELEGQIFRQD